jgi:hypothetical protein
MAYFTSPFFQRLVKLRLGKGGVAAEGHLLALRLRRSILGNSNYGASTCRRKPISQPKLIGVIVGPLAPDASGRATRAPRPRSHALRRAANPIYATRVRG